MAFFGKLGNILRQGVNRKIVSELRPAPSALQAIRCMCSAPTTKLFIGGVSYSTDEQSLRDAFSRYGEVLDARIIMDRETGRSRGFGFITFNSVEEASSAIQALDGQDLHGRRVRVNYANERPRVYGGGGGGSYGGSPYGGGAGYAGAYDGSAYGGASSGGGYGGNVDGGYGGGGYGGGSSGPGGNYGGSGAANNYSAPNSFGTSNAGSGTGSAGGYDGSGGIEYGGRGQFDRKDSGIVNEDLGGDRDSIDGNFSDGDDAEDSINDNDDADDFAKRA